KVVVDSAAPQIWWRMQVRSDTSLAQLHQVLQVSYVYDFGGVWVHRISVEKTLAAVAGRTYPHCTGGTAGPARPALPRATRGLAGHVRPGRLRPGRGQRRAG